MQGLGILILSVLAVVVKGQLGAPSCDNIPEWTGYILNTKGSPTYHLKHSNLNLFKINSKLPLKFIIHGWNQTATDPIFVELTQELLKKEDMNIIGVDYSEVAAQPYSTSLTKVAGVVKQVTRMFLGLKLIFGYKPRDIHVIGHSLGGQICGLLGKNVLKTFGEPLGRITVLDAARPAFETSLVADSMKLTKGDAVRVEAIHTDGWEIGLGEPVGHVDFYPNGGKRLQPNCVKGEALNVLNFTSADGWKPVYVTDLFCSHQRSIKYLTKSINNDIKATKCDSWENYKDGKCKNNEKVTFGENVEKTAEGVYYLDISV